MADTQPLEQPPVISPEAGASPEKQSEGVPAEKIEKPVEKPEEKTPTTVVADTDVAAAPPVSGRAETAPEGGDNVLSRG